MKSHRGKQLSCVAPACSRHLLSNTRHHLCDCDESHTAFGEQNHNCQCSTDRRPGLFFSFLSLSLWYGRGWSLRNTSKKKQPLPSLQTLCGLAPFIPVWTGPRRTLGPVQNCELQRRCGLQNSVSLWPVAATAPLYTVHLFLIAFFEGPPEVTFGKVCGIFPLNFYSWFWGPLKKTEALVLLLQYFHLREKKKVVF